MQTNVDFLAIDLDLLLLPQATMDYTLWTPSLDKVLL